MWGKSVRDKYQPLCVALGISRYFLIPTISKSNSTLLLIFSFSLIRRRDPVIPEAEKNDVNNKTNNTSTAISVKILSDLKL